MRKIWEIAWKDLYSTYTDRNAVLIMIAAPLAVATIVGLAFGGLSSGDLAISDIPVAIVNQDEGSGGQNYGQIFVSAFVDGAQDSAQTPACDAEPPSGENTGSQTTLVDLTDAVALDDPAAARAGVEDGDYTAAIIIPPDFTRKIAYGPGDPIEGTSIEVYANSGRALSAEIIRSITASIVNQIAAGNITAAATLETVSGQYGLLQMAAFATSESFSRNIGCAFDPRFNTLRIDRQTIAGQPPNNAAAILVLVGSSQAIFFTLFTAQAGAAGIFEERRQWTLQRLLVSPTPRLHILIGKLAGTFVTCILQIIFLCIALTLVGSLLSGELVFIWGDNLLSVALVIVASALAATGVGTLLTGLARTPEQAGIYASLIFVSMAVLGGSFGFQLPEALSRFSLIYWGSNAFAKLSANQGDIGLNLLILLAHGVILFTIGFWLFNRRMDI
jgi:ABC-2 type transport system permease protein